MLQDTGELLKGLIEYIKLHYYKYVFNKAKLLSCPKVKNPPSGDTWRDPKIINPSTNLRYSTFRSGNCLTLITVDQAHESLEAVTVETTAMEAINYYLDNWAETPNWCVSCTDNDVEDNYTLSYIPTFNVTVSE